MGLYHGNYAMDHKIEIEIEYDPEYTKYLNDKVTEKYYSGNVKRVGVHVSDLIYCLRKAWGKRNVPEDEWIQDVGDGDSDPLITWAGGLQFEDMVSEGEKQKVQAFCPTCRDVTSVPPPMDMGTHFEEVSKCPRCNKVWIIGTPDYVIDGVIHESKQTRKSQRKGPEGAPWWHEQLLSYLFFQSVRLCHTVAEGTYGRFVVNWLMGDWGERKKGRKPRPPRSAIEAFRMDVKGEWRLWGAELVRRMGIVLGKEIPPLSAMDSERIGEPTDTPKYGWECASCPVGYAINCTEYIWDKEGNEKITIVEEVTEEDGEPTGTSG